LLAYFALYGEVSEDELSSAGSLIEEWVKRGIRRSSSAEVRDEIADEYDRWLQGDRRLIE
jgi:hypothetical protein